MGFVQMLQGLGSYIAYYPNLNHVSGGVLASILLHKLIYLDQYRKDPDGVPIGEAKLMELTGFSRQELRTARSALVRNGLVKETAKGLPRKNYYLVIEDAVDRLWEKYLCSGESAKTISRRVVGAHLQPDKSCLTSEEAQSDKSCLTGETNLASHSQTNLASLSISKKIDKNSYSKTEVRVGKKPQKTGSDDAEKKKPLEEHVNALNGFPQNAEPSEAIQKQLHDRESSQASTAQPKTQLSDYGDARFSSKKEKVSVEEWDVNASFWPCHEAGWHVDVATFDEWMIAGMADVNHSWTMTRMPNGKRNDTAIASHLHGLEAKAKNNFGPESIAARAKLLGYWKRGQELREQREAHDRLLREHGIVEPSEPTDIKPGEIPEEARAVIAKLTQNISASRRAEIEKKVMRFAVVAEVDRAQN